jgi:hypothetical protein
MAPFILSLSKESTGINLHEPCCIFFGGTGGNFAVGFSRLKIRIRIAVIGRAAIGAQ